MNTHDESLLDAAACAFEAIKAERDALALGVDQWRVDFHELRIERNELQETITAMCNAIPNYDWSGDSAEKIADLVKERNTLQSAAQLALTALTRAVPKNAQQASEQTEAIAALKAVL